MIRYRMPPLLILSSRLKGLLADKTYTFSLVSYNSDFLFYFLVMDEVTKDTTQIHINDFKDKLIDNFYNGKKYPDDNILEDFDKKVNDFINRKQIIRQEKIEQIIKKPNLKNEK